jgi:tRNA(Ile)-lysidine synthase
MDFCYAFEKKVKAYMMEQRMAQKGDHLIAGVSGGADSVCLLELLWRFSKEEAWKITAVHVHHGIRGEEADLDEQFVEMFCQERKIPLEKRHYHIPLEAEKAKEGEEEAGRRLRYQAFSEVMQEKGGDKLVLAHHMDDQAETVLFHLIRGSSVKGLSGMQPVSGEKIRPLLCAEKQEICRYLSEKGIAYRTDQSNFSEQYARNCLRLSVLPVLEKMNGGAVRNINRAAARLLETEQYLSEQAGEAAVRLGVCSRQGEWNVLPVVLNREAYQREEPFLRKRVLYDLLCACSGGRKDIQECHVLSLDALFGKPEGKKIELAYGLCALSDGDCVRL